MTQPFDKKEGCFGCGACRTACPETAIRMVSDPEGFLYPLVDEKKCTDCGLCREICPGLQTPQGVPGTPYAVRCKDLQLLQASSSGGAFSLLAQPVLDQGGLVCGAVFAEDLEVRHVLTRQIGPMRKSKYVQSDLQDVYRPIETALAEGTQVLFTGTPCQCDGLRRYLGRQPENLILAAVICQGVQSPELWRDYVRFLSRQGEVRQYCFRDKQVRDNGHTVSYTAGGIRHSAPMNTDPFCRLYMKCITLRPSCYQCPYTRWELPFDLTIGDFWGIEKEYPQLDDGMGVSLVIARSQKGQALLDAAKPHAVILPVRRETVQQSALKDPAKQTILRKLLFRDLAQKKEDGSCDIPLILKKYGG